MQLRFCTSFALVTTTLIYLGPIGWSVENGPSDDILAVQRLSQADMELEVAVNGAETSEEKQRLQSELDTNRRQLPHELMELADKYPNTTGGLAALYWAAFISSDPTISQSASQLFQQYAAAADVDLLARSIRLGRSRIQESGGNLEIARVLLNRVKEHPTHARTPEVLTCVCRLSAADSTERRANSVFSDAADLIATHHAASPDITNFCEILGRGTGSAAWASSFERHLKSILEENEHRHIRCAASFALASVVQLAQEDRQEEVTQLYQRFLNEFTGEQEYHFQAIEQMYRGYASKELADLKLFATGKPALKTVGVDLDGKKMRLSDYNGKVVLLSFWATWCAPCIEFIPHEREIAKRFEGKAFSIVGVNGDTNIEAARSAVKSYGMKWRSFRNKDGDSYRISEIWRVSAWPTLYLIDSQGKIRKRWRNVSPEELSDAIEQLVAEASAQQPK